MLRPLFFAAIAGAALLNAAPAAAKEFVSDQAGMFSPSTVDALNTRIGNFNAQTGKEIIVQTVPSVPNGDVQAAAENAFSQGQVNGVLIFIDKGDRKDWIIPDRAAVQSGWWSSQTSQTIAQAMQAQFKAGDFDGGITTAVSSALNVYRSHLSSLQNGNAVQRPATYGQPAQSAQSGGTHISIFWWIIIALIAFAVIRSLTRVGAGGYSGGYRPGYGPGYGAPGYGGGYGGWGGGGGFWSGLLGGLGGAWLGNQMFDRNNAGAAGGALGAGGAADAGNAAPSDAGGWQSDPGQAGLGGGGGDWGGGGFGGGDGGFGGGGGGFGGGGGGDAGGGW